MTLRGRERVADRIETALVVRGAQPIGLDPLHAFFEKYHGLEPQRVNVGLREMERRARLLGARYPFKIHGEYAVQAQNGAAQSVYTALTLMAPGGAVRKYIAQAPDENMAVGFENVTVDAVSNLWGDAGQALRFGWPSDIGRPPEFDLAIRWLAGKVGVEIGQGYRQPRRKDGGVDVVSWRPFPDGRPGFPLVLVQCTLQDNLLAKGMDIDARLWSSWLSMDFDPIAAIATPAAIAAGPTWDELALKYLVLDRIRLVGLAKAAITDELTQEWVNQVIRELTVHMEEIGEL